MRRGEQDRRATEQAGRRASRAVILGGLFIVGATIAGTGLLSLVLDGANLALAHRQGRAVFLLRPHWFIWIMIAFPMAAPAALLAYDPLVRRLKGPPPPRWSIEYLMVFDSTPRMVRLSLVAVIGVFALISLYNIPYHVRVTDGGIYVAEPGAWRESPTLHREVARVSLARYYVAGSRGRRGGPSHARGLFITDRKGGVWTPVCSTLDVKPERSAEIALFVASRAGVPVQYPNAVVGAPCGLGASKR